MAIGTEGARDTGFLSEHLVNMPLVEAEDESASERRKSAQPRSPVFFREDASALARSVDRASVRAPRYVEAERKPIDKISGATNEPSGAGPEY